MKYCYECGRKVNETAKFCDECGTALTASQTMPREATPSTRTTPIAHEYDTSYQGRRVIPSSQENDQQVIRQEEPVHREIYPKQATAPTASAPVSTNKKQSKWVAVGKFFFTLLIIFYSYLTVVMPNAVYVNRNSNSMFVEIEQRVESFFATENSSAVGVLFSHKLFKSSIVTSYVKLDVETDLQENFLRFAGFDDHYPIYRYIMEVPLDITLRDQGISGTAVAEVEVVIQAISHIGYADVGTIRYDSILYDFGQAATIAVTLPVSIEKAYLGYTFYGDPMLHVDYVWTNYSDDYACAAYSVSGDAYQGNKALSINFFSDKSKNGGTEIAPNTSITVTQTFYLDNDWENVTFQITPWLNFEDNPPSISEEFILGDL